MSFKIAKAKAADAGNSTAIGKAGHAGVGYYGLIVASYE